MTADLPTGKQRVILNQRVQGASQQKIQYHFHTQVHGYALKKSRSTKTPIPKWGLDTPSKNLVQPKLQPQSGG